MLSSERLTGLVTGPRKEAKPTVAGPVDQRVRRHFDEQVGTSVPRLFTDRCLVSDLMHSEPLR